MADRTQLYCGIGFTVANFGGQFLFSEPRETLLLIIGCFIHLIACALLGFAMIMLFNTIFNKTVTTMGRAAPGVDIDMIIAYSLFCFTGIALTCVAVFLRNGSFWWNFFTIALGVAAAAAVEPSIRMKLKKRSDKMLSREEEDTWSAGGGSSEPAGGMRQRH